MDSMDTDQPITTATAAAEVAPASTENRSEDITTGTAAQQENGGVSVGSVEGKGEGDKPDDAIDDARTAEGSSSVDNVLEHGGDAARGDQAGSRGKRPPRVGSVRQGRKEKRKAEWKAKKARIKENKLHQRQQREEAALKEGRELPSAGANYRDLPPEQWSVSQKINHAKRLEFEEKSTQGGYRVCIDMSFYDLMLERAQASVGQQVMYAYSKNRKATQPCLITLSGLGEVMRAQVGKLTGFDTWLGVTTDSRCYTEIFDKEELVYLTADSPKTITLLEKGKVYILGGLVDRNAHKGLCFKKATDQGIATAKLPLKREDLNGAHTKVLATNHVFDILVQAMGAGGNLEQIQEKTLPPRKRAGWTGGDDRGPSSQSAAKQAGQEIAEGKVKPGSVEEPEQDPPKDRERGVAAAVSTDPPGDSTSTNDEDAAKRKHDYHSEEADLDMTTAGRDRDAKRGSAGEVGVKGEEEGVTEETNVGVAGATSETVVVKRAVEADGDLSASPSVDALCKRGRTDIGGSGVA